MFDLVRPEKMSFDLEEIFENWREYLKAIN